MSVARLAQDIAAHHHVPALEAGIASSLGAGSLAELPPNHVTGHHIASSEASISAYVLTKSSFSLYEATADGKRLTVVIPRSRWRRAALYEDPSGAQLTLEFDADRASISGTLGTDQVVTASVNCATYVITETQLPGIESLRRLGQAFATALTS